VKRVLVVYWWPPGEEMRLAVSRHLHALDGRGVDVVYANAAHGISRRLRLPDYDGVVLHTTFLCARWYHDFDTYARSVRWLARLDCPKIAVPQDEYDHAHVLDEWLESLGVSHVYTNFGAAQRAVLYPRLGARATFVEVLTGYVDEGLAAYCQSRALPLASRAKDIVYRAQQLPFWFGSHGQLKHRIGLAVSERADAFGLDVDISTRPDDTILGPAWADFLMSGKVVLGTESGSSVLDARGEVRRRIRELLAVDPHLTFEEVDARMPQGWDAYAFFAISPRHLEAVVSGTSQLLVRGTYSRVLEAGRHYVPVERDLTDLDRALEHVSDVESLQAVANRAYEEVFLEGQVRMEDFAGGLLDALARERPHSLRRPASPWMRNARRAIERLPSPVMPVAGPLARAHLRVRLRTAELVAVTLASQPGLLRALAGAAVSRRLGTQEARALVADLLRLALLVRFEASQRADGGTWRVGVARENATLLFVSNRDGALVEIPETDGVERVFWDHSRVGTSIPIDAHAPWLGAVDLGPEGRYEFTAMARLTRQGVRIPWAEILHRRDAR
jgi:hypothetical protein